MDGGCLSIDRATLDECMDRYKDGDRGIDEQMGMSVEEWIDR